MTSPPSYSVITVDNLIKADLQGQWDAASDIGYLTELSAAMSQMRNKPWGLVVDLRGWVVSEAMRNFKNKTIYHMDRRNQEMECWLIDDLEQGSHLVHYIKKADIPFKRCTSVVDANIWLAQFGYQL